MKSPYPFFAKRTQNEPNRDGVFQSVLSVKSAAISDSDNRGLHDKITDLKSDDVYAAAVKLVMARLKKTRKLIG